MSVVASRCPLCSSEDIAVFLDSKTENLHAAALGSSRTDVSSGRVMRCRRCLFGFRQYRPGESDLGRLYRDLDVAVYESELPGRERTAQRHVGILQRYATTPGHLLDVGCASGLFLQKAAARGWQVTGVEPSRALYERARRHLNGNATVLFATLQDAGLTAGSFDAVTLWDVLEHVTDPVAFLKLCGSLLQSGGHLLVNVPDLDSWQSRILGRRWPLLLAEHLNYFNAPSLKACGELSGFEWLGSGRRNVSFSLGYCLYRLSQHRIPGASMSHRLANRTGLSRTLVSIPLGELYAVWRKR